MASTVPLSASIWCPTGACHENLAGTFAIALRDGHGIGISVRMHSGHGSDRGKKRGCRRQNSRSKVSKGSCEEAIGTKLAGIYTRKVLIGVIFYSTVVYAILNKRLPTVPSPPLSGYCTPFAVATVKHICALRFGVNAPKMRPATSGSAPGSESLSCGRSRWCRQF